MPKKSTVFHIAAAIAFLSATPLIAGGISSIFIPNLTYPEPIEAPTKDTNDQLKAVPKVDLPATGDQRTGGWIIEVPNRHK